MYRPPRRTNTSAQSLAEDDSASAHYVLSDADLQRTFEGVTWARSRQHPMTASMLGAGRIVSCAGGGPQEVRRKVNQRDSTNRKFSLLVNLGGFAELDYRGRYVPLAAGTLALIDGSLPCVLSLPTAYKQLIVEFPRDLIGRRHPDLLRGSSAGSLADEPAGQLLLQMAALAAASAPTLTLAARGHLSDAIVSMLGALSCAAPRTRSTAERRLQYALADIETRLSDPDLCPAAVAALQGISRRRLDAIFAERGLSVERVIWERRLDRAASEMTGACPTNSTRGLFDIALSWGFSSAAHFSRSFRARFGCSPSTYRRASAAVSSMCAANGESRGAR